MPYQFDYDWFSVHIPLMDRLLSPFKGKPARALEIGTHEGRSATWLLTHILTHPESRLLCIDIFEQPVLRANLQESGASSRVEVRIGRSSELLHSSDLLPDSFDFAYVDGSHSSCDVLEDAVNVFRLIRVGGIIGFDDYEWDDPQFNQHGTPKPAVDAFVHCYAHKLAVLERGYQVWLQKVTE
jgi:predicted O-methyltransferase YrrM